MIAEIIPTQKLPRGLSSLSYKIPAKYEANIKIGQLFYVPLRRSTILGVVADIKKQTPYRFVLKYLDSRISEKPIFTQGQLSLFLSLSKYYAVSASLFTHYSLPKILKSEWDKLPENITTPNRQKGTLKYFWWGNQKEKSAFYKKNINNYLRSGQILIIVPKISDIKKITTALEINAADYSPIHSQLSRAQYFDNWCAALGGHKKIFIGTRSALFFPFSHLNLIIVDDEHSPDHKQYDMTPRYTVKKICQTLNQIQKTAIIFSSPCPSLENFHEFTPRPKNHRRTINIVNLEDELTNKNYSFISDPLLTAIKKTLVQDKKIFLFTNKKGDSSTNSCSDCGYTFYCPSCTLPLIKEKENKLICYYCHHEEDFPPFCPKCSGPNFKSLGLGIEKIFKNIKKVLPEASAILCDSNNYKKESPPNNYQIIIGTEFAIDKIDWTNIGLLGIINADQLWQHSEFMASERAYQTLVNLLTSTTKNAKLIIQTFSPHSTLIKALKQDDPQIFYQEELAIRKKFSYPPFARLIKISTLDKNENKALSRAQKIYQQLKAIDAFGSNGPLPINRRQIRGQYKFNIIIKLKNDSDFTSISKIISSDCLIDIDPQTLLD